LKKVIEDNGGKIGSSICQNNYVVAGDNMGPAKLEKAGKLNIPILTETDFIKLMKINTFQTDILRDENDKVKLLPFIFYYSVVILSEVFNSTNILYVFTPLIALAMMFLYWNTSRVRNPLSLVFLFSLVTNLFFIPNTKKLFFWDDNSVGLSRTNDFPRH
jgi:hypothetical protein